MEFVSGQHNTDRKRMTYLSQPGITNFTFYQIQFCTKLNMILQFAKMYDIEKKTYSP